MHQLVDVGVEVDDGKREQRERWDHPRDGAETGSDEYELTPVLERHFPSFPRPLDLFAS